MNEWMNEWTNEWMNKWMNEQMNEWMIDWINVTNYEPINEWGRMHISNYINYMSVVMPIKCTNQNEINKCKYLRLKHEWNRHAYTFCLIHY
jgi:hypothetical protein